MNNEKDEFKGMSITEYVKDTYGLDKEECLELLKNARHNFYYTFGDKDPFFQNIIIYYSKKIEEIEKEITDEIENLNNLWDNGN